MNLSEKIIYIINESGISNTKFADYIEVSRPTISHIMSGRNKPSIDIVQKIMGKFPELGHKWFLDDEEIDATSVKKLAENHGLNSEIRHESSSPESSISIKPSPLPVNLNVERLEQLQSSPISKEPQRKSVIEKIVIHYSDGSMEVLKGGGQIIF